MEEKEWEIQDQTETATSYSLNVEDFILPSYVEEAHKTLMVIAVNRQVKQQM